MTPTIQAYHWPQSFDYQPVAPFVGAIGHEPGRGPRGVYRCDDLKELADACFGRIRHQSYKVVIRDANDMVLLVCANYEEVGCRAGLEAIAELFDEHDDWFDMSEALSRALVFEEE